MRMDMGEYRVDPPARHSTTSHRCVVAIHHSVLPPTTRIARPHIHSLILVVGPVREPRAAENAPREIVRGSALASARGRPI
jgi:hypothetical protein